MSRLKLHFFGKYFQKNGSMAKETLINAEEPITVQPAPMTRY
jgi:hypothetical protein